MRGMWRINPFYWVNKNRLSIRQCEPKVETFGTSKPTAKCYIKVPNSYQSKTPSQTKILLSQRAYHAKVAKNASKTHFNQKTTFNLANLNPTRWSKRTVRIFTVAFFLIMVPIYLYIGFQPNLSIEALSYPSLIIEDLKLETPVAPIELEDRELKAPATIAGVYSPSENKHFIIGHSSTVFKSLYRLRAGAKLTFNNITYQVTEISTVRKTDVDMNTILSPSDSGTIIIMTCAGEPRPNQDATHRLIITAKEVTGA